MAATPTNESIAADLSSWPNGSCSPASRHTDWQAANMTHATAQQMLVRGLIERDRAATRYALNETRCARSAPGARPDDI
jgi:hypothetical protein